ncbi:MAG: acyl-CoA thioesterase II [Pseudomonadales bacterium]|nr:acyl-CoA thioesterase II [Pseudomonadales bacterium]MCP5185923.1 acyl-CoA thioesterase II [Pseudomonadales bacterium]
MPSPAPGSPANPTPARTGNAVLDDILDIMNVEPIEQNLYRGRNHDTEHVFGGQVLAQAITAAHRTVRPEHHLHSLHAYFLRAGDWRLPILYEVDRIRDGRSFSTRRVVAIQHGKAIFNLSSSWHTPETGLRHTTPMPNVLPPQCLRSDRELFAELARTQPDVKRYAFRFDAIDSRQVESLLMVNEEPHPPFKHTWLRAREPLPADESVHLGLLAYMSDLDFMSTSMLPHGGRLLRDHVYGASLDHAMWIHRPFRADEWLLFAKTSPNACGARGFVRGHFFTEAGELVATAAQECLIRPLDAPRKR